MIIDELLAFASSRMNVVPFDVLVKLMSNFYTDEVVEASKQVLFETAFSNRNAEPPHQYSHKRRGQDKKSKNIQDIISVFLELPPHVTPSYVAKDLSNLPPLNMNCFDVSALVKDIEALKLHVAVLHESHRVLLKAQLTSRPGESISSQPEIRPELAARSPECGPEPQPPEHQTELETQPHTEPEMQQLTVPETQPQTEPETHSRADSVSATQHTTLSLSDESVDIDSDTSEDGGDLRRLAAIQFSKPARKRCGRQHHTEQQTVPTEQPRRFNPPSQRYRYSEVVKRGGNSRRPVGKLPLKRGTEPIARTRDTSTINASAKPPRRTNANPTDNRYAAPIIGRGRSSKILAAKKSTSTAKGTTENRQVGLFVTRLATKTRAADVAAHVSLETGLTVKCEPIKTKYDGYRSFYVKLSPHDQHMLLNANLWPKGVLVKAYRE